MNKPTILLAAFVLVEASILGVAWPVQQPTVQARAVRPVSLTGNLVDVSAANDGLPNTRAYSSSPQYAGASLTVDIGGEQNVIGVIQDHGRWPPHYPGAYKVEAATDASGPWTQVAEAAGHRGESKVLFEPIRGRFVRITATKTDGGGPDWSVAEVKVIIDPGATPRRVPGPPDRRPDEQRNISGNLRSPESALDNKLESRATSGTPNYAGMWLMLDLGGEYEISRVVQLHGQWAEDHPAEYKVEVSRRRNDSEFRQVWIGPGEPNRSVARFDQVTTRYIRITALRPRDQVRWWSIAELRTNRDDQDVVEHEEGERRIDRTIRRIIGQGLSNLNSLTDPNPRTRATSGSPSYAGSWIQADLGGSYTVSRVLQIHNPDDDFPGRYRIEVSDDGRNWKQVWEGEGEPGRSRANFNPVRAQFVRITATANRNNRHPWSISSLRISG